MKNKTNHDDGNPKFGRLLIVLFSAVIFSGFLTWLMATYFPDFGLPEMITSSSSGSTQ